MGGGGVILGYSSQLLLGSPREQTATVIVKEEGLGEGRRGKKGTKRNMRSGRGEDVSLPPRGGPIPAYKLATGRGKIKSKDQVWEHIVRGFHASEPRQNAAAALVLEYFSTAAESANSR